MLGAIVLGIYGRQGPGSLMRGVAGPAPVTAPAPRQLLWTVDAVGPRATASADGPPAAPNLGGQPPAAPTTTGQPEKK